MTARSDTASPERGALRRLKAPRAESSGETERMAVGLHP